ncbi:MAG: hypothetical protein ABIP07_03750 [Sphingomicrobium sp.]
MVFQPFGYRFNIRSPMRREDTRAAIQARLKNWFDPMEGARGWMIGPFLCLWSSVFNRNGPMVLARIVENGFSTRIRGRAGSDLNGTIWLMILTLLMAFVLAQEVSSGQASPEQLLLYGGLFAVGIPLVLWICHSDRHEADHLVRFLGDVVTPSAKSRRAAATSVRMAKRFVMDVSGEKASESATGESIYDALLATGQSDFLILASDEEFYIQALGQQAGIVIEKREGSAEKHFRAIRRIGENSSDVTVAAHFSFEEAWDVLSAYVSGLPLPAFLEWERMSIGTDPYVGG